MEFHFWSSNLLCSLRVVSFYLQDCYVQTIFKSRMNFDHKHSREHWHRILWFDWNIEIHKMKNVFRVLKGSK